MSQLLIQQKEHRKKRRNKRLLKFGLVLFLILVIFFGLVFLSRMSRFRIGAVELSGEVLVNPDEVVSASDQYLSGYYIGLFPRNNFFIYPQSALQKFLKEKFQRIDTIKTNLVGFKKLEIVITERQQQALWCDGSPETASVVNASSTSVLNNENCYFLDDNGLVFSVAPNFSGDAYFKYYGSVGGDSPIGQTYLSTSTVFREMSDFVDQVKQTSVTPVSITASSSGEFTMQLSSGGKIYFNQSQPFSKSADNLKALLQTLQTSSSTASLNIDYIDLRFGDKLYYKMK